MRTKSKELRLINIIVQDVRFHASKKRARKDVKMIDPDPNYSCLYITIETENEKYKGYGIVVGKDTNIMMRVAESLFHKFLKDRKTTEMYKKFATVWRKLTPKKSRWVTYYKMRAMKERVYIRPAAVAITNALWDLRARIEDKPVWKLLTDMTPNDLVSTIDFSRVKNVITREVALQMLTENRETRETYEKALKKDGYPTSATGIYDKPTENRTRQRIRDLCRNFKKLDFTTFEVFAKQELSDSMRRCSTIYQMIGRKRRFVLNANEVSWNVENLLSFLQNFRRQNKPYCIEISAPCTDEQREQIESGMNKSNVQNSSGEKSDDYLKFQDFAESDLPHIWQLNIAKIALHEALLVYLMAHKKNTPVWSHGDGLGLGEMGQHLQMWDFICLSQTTENRMIELVNYQHGYFEDPVYIRNACHMPPTRPGFSTKLKDKCISRWSFPEGTRWKLIEKHETERKKKEAEKDDKGDTV